jgi:Zn-dependent metalloprotease
MMPERNATNGLNTFSLHASEQSSAEVMAQLRKERRAYPGFALDAAVPQRELDPETTARRYLGQALDSAAAPALTALEAAGTTSTFRTISTETVPLTGTKTVKFRQTLHEIPVYGSLVTVELDDHNDLVSIDSALGEPTDVDPVAEISPAQAMAAARKAPDGYQPSLVGVVPHLHYYFDRNVSTWRLVYILEDVPVVPSRSAKSGADRTSDFEPPRFVDYVVDAHTGDVVAVLPRTPSMAAAGEQTAVDSFGVSRTFLATQENGRLVLKDAMHNVETYDFGFADPVIQGRALPGAAITNPPEWSPAAVSSHANAVAVSDFLRTVLMRNNIDDRGGPIISTINCVVAEDSLGQNQWRNAFWNRRQMVYGQMLHDGKLQSLSANIDVVGHEIFHGVTDHTSRLEYAVQSGALNESYSDIFGTIIANQGNPDPRTWDWLLGERLLPGDKPFRDVSDPPRFGQPDHMDDFRVMPDDQDGDWGGVHINSGIHNKAAYLLLTTENRNDTLAVTPAEVAAVFYLALTQRLSRTSQFADSRRTVITSARTLFRNLPAEEAEQKIKAIETSFDAVGIL